jgi:argininosuccinate lyase
MNSHSTESTGRLSKPLDSEAHKIWFTNLSPKKLLHEFTQIAKLNEAHLAALQQTNLLSKLSIEKLLIAIAELKANQFQPLFERPNYRGSYLLFEGYLTEQLGIDISGSLHIGRSRNDINATLFKMNLRPFFLDLHDELYSLRTALIERANKFTTLAMPIYSQFQVAQIGTYAYYLLATEEALSRDQKALQLLLTQLNECPLGAAGGCGSSINLDRQLLCDLLGFETYCNNALDAVASRDIGLRLLTQCSTLGTTLSRIAHDFQLWTTSEFAFFDLPDDFCGSSSMMPQKKNPYLIEAIKGKVASINGALMQALTAMHNVPFSNSVEVGTCAFSGFEFSLSNLIDALKLSRLLIKKAAPEKLAMQRSIKNGVAIATHIAEYNVKHNHANFRKMHHKIGEVITQAIRSGKCPNTALTEFYNLDMTTHNPLSWAHCNEYGGGPGKQATDTALDTAQSRLNNCALWINACREKWGKNKTPQY